MVEEFRWERELRRGVSLQENQDSRSRVYTGQTAEVKSGGTGEIKLHLLSLKGKPSNLKCKTKSSKCQRLNTSVFI